MVYYPSLPASRRRPRLRIDDNSDNHNDHTTTNNNNTNNK